MYWRKPEKNRQEKRKISTNTHTHMYVHTFVYPQYCEVPNRVTAISLLPLSKCKLFGVLGRLGTSQSDRESAKRINAICSEWHCHITQNRVDIHISPYIIICMVDTHVKLRLIVQRNEKSCRINGTKKKNTESLWIQSSQFLLIYLIFVFYLFRQLLFRMFDWCAARFCVCKYTYALTQIHLQKYILYLTLDFNKL